MKLKMKGIKMSNTVEQKLFNEIDKICKSTDLLQTLPLNEKVKLLEFSP